MIAIVGGGFTGLALAMELRRRDFECIVFEGKTRPGGVIQSDEIDGRVLDRGPQRIRLTSRVNRLIRELKLQDQLLTAPDHLPLWVFKDGRLIEVPSTLYAFLRTDLVGFAAKLRFFLEPFTRGPNPEERVSIFFIRKFGRELYEGLLGPLYGGLYGSDPADMQVGHSLISTLHDLGVRRSLLRGLLRVRRRTQPKAASFHRGMETLPSALAGTLGDRLELGSPVQRIEDRNGGWRLKLKDRICDARTVVLTTPADVTADLLGPFAPRAASAIASLNYNALAVVHLDAQAALHGMGFQVALTEGHRPLRGVTFNNSMFGRRDIFTAYLGGARCPDVGRLDNESIAQLAVEEFRQCTGHPARALAVHCVKVPAWDVSWAGLAGLALPRGIHLAANWWSRPGLSGRLSEVDQLARNLTGVTEGAGGGTKCRF